MRDTISVFRNADMTIFLTKRLSFRGYPAILLLFASALMLPAGALAGAEKPGILYINSYENGYAWSDNILSGVRSAIEDSRLAVNLQIEYMDTKKHYDRQIEKILLDYYRYKFRNVHFDVVIVSDNNAFEFMLRYRQELTPGVPLVFCGINDFNPALIAGYEDVTGIVENIHFKDIIETALAFRPDTQHLIIIGDHSATGNAIENQIRNALPHFSGRLSVEFRKGFSQPGFLQQISRIPEDSMLFLVPFYEDIHGNLYSARDVLATIERQTDVPIYSCWEFLLGHGIVGGKLTSGRRQGREAAAMALRILKGENPASISVAGEIHNGYRFDYHQLKKQGLLEKKLPAGSQVINQPYQFYKLNRQVFWVIIISLVMLGVVTIFLIINIMDRRTAEKKYRSIFENAGKGIFIATPEGLYLNVNPAFARILGCDSVAEALSMLNDSESAGALKTSREAFWERILKGDQLADFEMEFLRRDDSICWVSVNARTVFDNAGDPQYVEAFVEDITQRINLEKQLLQSQKMEALGILSGGIAHDFNNILTSIINSAELALEDLAEETPTHGDLKRVLKAANRGSQLVQQILTFSRPSREGFRPIDISTVVSDALGLIKASLPGNIKVIEHIRREPGLCIADPIQIHQIVMNLCTNSIQSMGDKSGILEIGLEKTKVDDKLADMLTIIPGRYWKLTVADNGPGIPPDILDKIFDPFFTTKEKGEGTGLGLAVVHGIVTGHKGGIAVNRLRDKIVFEIYLPRDQDNSMLDDGIAAAPQRGQERILFVEDDEDQRDIIPRVLRQLGYEVTAAGSAVEALQLFLQQRPPFDLVITDFDMPETNGFELAAELETVSPHTPVMIVSGRKRMASMKATGNIKKMIVKPYNRTIISEAIRQILEPDSGSGQQREQQ